MTGPSRVVVVAETPSLARSISDLLETEGIHVITVHDARGELGSTLQSDGASIALVISASNGFYCETARRWMRGEVAGVDLVVVGSRDPDLRSGPRVHVVGLPLAPSAFLKLVRHLLDQASIPSATAGGPAHRRAGRPPRRRLPGPRKGLTFAPVRVAGAV